MKQIWIGLLGLVLVACNDMYDVERPLTPPAVDEDVAVYVLSEGLFNLNNSTLGLFSLNGGASDTDFFRTVNQRGLGDTGNDMKRYGDRLYVVVNVSSQVEVLDVRSGRSLRRIPMFADDGVARQPRQVAFHEDKAYVSSFDGTVARIDTASLEVEGYVRVGRNPDGLCVAKGKLYVANSGGLDYPNYDESVSVIDLRTFTETKKIGVAVNPSRLAADAEGDVYLVSQGNLADVLPCFQKIDTDVDELVATYPLAVRQMTIHGNWAYVYVHDEVTGDSGVQVFDCVTDEVVDEQFVKDGTQVQTPYSFTIHPVTEDLYVTEAYGYTTWGDVLCFSSEGKLKFRLNEVGLNPKALVFADDVVGVPDGDQDTIAQLSSYATRVLEYVPAPGQFINTATSCYEPGFTAVDVLERANELLDHAPSYGAVMSLGAWGGYVTLGFDQPIVNVLGVYDFKVYGNSFSNSAEPGVVQVSVDANGNGVADDVWYEIWGSEHDSADVVHDYEVTYYRPAVATDSVRWTDNQGGEGKVARRSGHTHSYYPEWIMSDSYTLRGTRMPANAIDVGTDGVESWSFRTFDWGYADNHSNKTDGSNIQLEWAVDMTTKQPVALDSVHFVRIYTGLQQACGWVGETSTEVCNVEILINNK